MTLVATAEVAGPIQFIADSAEMPQVALVVQLLPGIMENALETHCSMLACLMKTTTGNGNGVLAQSMADAQGMLQRVAAKKDWRTKQI